MESLPRRWLSSCLILCQPIWSLPSIFGVSGSPHPPTDNLQPGFAWVTFGNLDKAEKIPVVPARAAELLSSPLGHSDTRWWDLTGLQDWVGFCGFVCSFNHHVMFLWYCIFFGLKKCLMLNDHVTVGLPVFFAFSILCPNKTWNRVSCAYNSQVLGQALASHVN